MPTILSLMHFKVNVQDVEEGGGEDMPLSQTHIHSSSYSLDKCQGSCSLGATSSDSAKFSHQHSRYEIANHP